MVSRFTALVLGIGLAYAFLLFHLFDLQLKNGEYYIVRAESQYLASEALKAKRGTIYFKDRSGNLVAAAANRDFPIIYAVPKVIEDPSETAHQLASILGKPVEELLRHFSKPDDTYKLLVRKADPEVAKRVEDLKIKGIYTQSVPERFYPFRILAAHLLGFVGPNEDNAGESGHYGLEELYDETLAGLPGKLQDNSIVSPQPGEDLTLTIDPAVQIEAESILAKLVRQYGAKGGSVIVQEPHSGRILAMGSYPNFDPNDYRNAALSDFINPAVQQIYEPGSIFKVITMAAGIDSGAITPETEYFDRGYVVLNGRRVENWDLKKHGPYGRATMKNVIEQSINTGAIFAQREMSREVFRKYVENFGFGERTAIGLPGEVKGDLRQLSPQARDIAFATASYGHGVAVTPIGLINAIAAIGNGGKLMRPYLDARLEPLLIREVVSPETAQKVSEMMISAVDKAEVAAIKGYTLAGKTGTAFVPDFKQGGYTEKVVNTYVGFGPVSKPRFIILIKLDEPEGAPVAALTVVPAFRDLAQFILNYYQIPPDRL